jgi:glycosyltransferase involved in cell wall biosynthesis
VVQEQVTARPVFAVVPAYDAESSVGDVVRALAQIWPWKPPGGAIVVIDDGSSDATSRVAASAGAIVVRHETNRGKGAALRTGFERTLALGATVAVTVDADGQHLPDEAVRLAMHPAPEEALVLGVRDLVRDGAPKPNRISNGISNFFLSLFSGQELRDTQCGLRRYPLRSVPELGAHDDGYAFEAEVVLRACRAKIPIVQVPIRVHYPPEHLRITHFDSVRDPARIVFRVLETLAFTRVAR